MWRALETEYGWVWSGRVLHPFFRRCLAGSRGVGRWGEWLALRHLRRLGWDVVARNWTTRLGEVDLVAWQTPGWSAQGRAPPLVFLEVKTLLNPSKAFRPEDHFTERKLQKLESLALEFLRRYELPGGAVRFDLVAVETPDLRSFELRHYVL